MKRSTELLLSAALLAVGVSKIASGHHPSFVLPELLFYVLAILDVLAALALLANHGVAAAGSFAVAVGAGGALLAMVFAGHRCGCLGVWVELSPSAHLAAASTVGALGALVVAGCCRDPRGSR